MGIFGVQTPKIIVNIDTTQDEVLLDYSVILKDEPELDSYGVKAVRTGKQVFTNAGKHWIFEVKIHLWKYADPKAKYLELKSYEGTKVYLYRHADGEPICDDNRNPSKFLIESVNESYIDEFNLYDVLTISLRSIDVVNSNLLTTVRKYIYEQFTGNSYRTDLLEKYEYPINSGSIIVANNRLEVSGSYVNSNSENFGYLRFSTKIKGLGKYDIDVSGFIERISFLYNSTSQIFIGIFSDINNFAGIGMGFDGNHYSKYFYRINGATLQQFATGYSDAQGGYFRTVLDSANEIVRFYILINGVWTFVNSINVAGWSEKSFYVGVFAGALNINNNWYAVDNLAIEYTYEVSV